MDALPDLAHLENGIGPGRQPLLLDIQTKAVYDCPRTGLTIVALKWEKHPHFNPPHA